MLFDSSLRRELARSFGVTLVVLVTVVMTMTLIRTLGQASRGGFNPSDVTLVMGYTVLAYLPTLLALGLFIAVIASLSRMYRDSEMVIWFCSGRGLFSVLASLLRFAWPVLLVIAALSLFVLPWSNGRVQELKARYEQRGDLERIMPGQFQESANGSRVFFVEKNLEAGRTGSNVFIVTTEKNRQTITSARSGRIETLPHGQFLVLHNGQRLESALDSSELKLSEFESYSVQIRNRAVTAAPSVPVKTRSTLELLADPVAVHRGELAWRFGMVLAAFNFVLIGALVSSVNPRVNQGVNLVFALFAFVVYFNLLNLGQSWVATGKLGLLRHMLALHGGVFLLGLVWMSVKHFGWAWPRLFRGRAAT